MKCQTAASGMERRQRFLTKAKDGIVIHRSNQKYYSDKSRRHFIFTEGDLAMLHSKAFEELSRADLSKKRRPKYLGPLCVKNIMGPVTFEIEMPPSMKRAHNVIHVSELKPSVQRENEEATIDVVIDADATVEQAVQTILSRRRANRRYEYLVQFIGQPTSETIYLPRTELPNCMELVRDFDKSLI